MTSQVSVAGHTAPAIAPLRPLPAGFAASRRNLHQVGLFALAPKRYAEPGRRDPLPPADPDAAIEVDPAVSRALATAQSFAREVLGQAGRLRGPDDNVSELQLWPEHCDQAFEMGSVDCGARASYGASPGDGAHPEPYLYVAPWLRRPRSDPYWNDPSFAGASLSYAELTATPDQVAHALDFLSTGYRLLTGEIGTRS